MIPDDLSSLGPLFMLGLTAVVAMLLAPLFHTVTVRAAAGIGLFAAATLAWRRIGLPEAPAFDLLADDGLARFGALFAALSGLGALICLRGEGPGREAPALTALAALGAAALAAASHAATLFLGIEIVSLSLIALFAFPLARRSLEAGYKYLLLGGAASAALLLGIAMIYAESGALTLSGWGGAGGGVAALGAALVLGGLAFKFALVPFHAWTPDAYEAAPAGAAALAAVASKGALALALLRIALEGAPGGAVWAGGLALMAAASILLGNLLALMQDSLARMLGWSSVAHSGYIAAILASGAPLAPEAALFYLIAYAPALLAAFCVAAALGPSPGLAEMRGFARARPLAGAAFGMAMLSLAGLPIASGFLAKIYLFGALVQAELWWLLGVAALGSAVGLFYYARFGLAPYNRDTAEPAPVLGPADGALLALCAAAIAIFGVYPRAFLDFAAELLG
jgi:NADH-quinone oxidoreductase subunit N